jgi:hypothetical protein
MVADTSVNVPGYSAPFTEFIGARISNGNVSFWGGRATSLLEGIYYAPGGGHTYETVAYAGQPVPPPTDHLQSGEFEGFHMYGSEVALCAGYFSSTFPYPNAKAVFTWNSGGSLTVLADEATSVPDRMDYLFSDFFYSPSLDNGKVAYHGLWLGNTQNGIFTDLDSASVYLVADESTIAPPGTGTFNFIDSVVLDGGAVLFTASATAGSYDGVFIYKNSVLSAVATVNNTAPGATGNFTSFGGLSHDNGVTVFRGNSSDGTMGIYQIVNGGLSKMIDTNDLIEGQPLYSLGLMPKAFENHQVALTVIFADYTQKTYVVEGVGMPSAAADWCMYE